MCRQDHTDPVPSLQKHLVEGALRSLEGRLALVAGMSQHNERVGAMFEHLDREAFGETLCRSVEVVEHCVALPPPH